MPISRTIFQALTGGARTEACVPRESLKIVFVIAASTGFVSKNARSLGSTDRPAPFPSGYAALIFAAIASARTARIGCGTGVDC